MNNIGFSALFLLLFIGCEGRLSVAITDAPIDDAERVVIAVTAVTVKPSSESEQRFSFDPPRSIDLLALQGRNSEQLINESLDEGNYDYIELEIAADDDTLDSFIEFRDGRQRSLKIDSSASSRLRLTQIFSITEGDTERFTIDFDLHRSIFRPTDAALEDGDDDYLLRPQLRLIRNSDAASVGGLVSRERITAPGCNNDMAADSGNSVYLYSGSDAETGDFGSSNEPSSAALVKLDAATGEYRYEFGFLAAGSYTLAFTCNSLLDNDGEDDGDDLQFGAAAKVGLEAGENATVNF